MSALVDKVITTMLAAAVLMLAWKLYRKEAPKQDAPVNPETEAIAEHLGSIESHLDQTSKLRREKRLGGHNGKDN